MFVIGLEPEGGGFPHLAMSVFNTLSAAKLFAEGNRRNNLSLTKAFYIYEVTAAGCVLRSTGTPEGIKWKEEK